jgi:hypothetical protein
MVVISAYDTSVHKLVPGNTGHHPTRKNFVYAAVRTLTLIQDRDD